ncbi:hypothetical protein [Nocardia wallacei]|nr:hypothetical protein [Nocardia wallacei]
MVRTLDPEEVVDVPDSDSTQFACADTTFGDHPASRRRPLSRG